MFTTELLKRAIAELKPAQLAIWLVAVDLGYENVSSLTINDAREYGITESTFYRNKNGIKVPCKDIYTDEYLDAIEQAAAKEAQISTKRSWQDKLKSLDLRSDRLKKAEKGLNMENDELILY